MDNREKSLQKKESIRVLISNVYDIQKLRIAAGNRLVQSFYIQMGVQPSHNLPSEQSESDAEKENAKLIDQLKKDYTLISKALVGYGESEDAEDANKRFKTVKSAIKGMGDQLQVIRSDMDYRLVNSYMLLLQSEEDSIKVLKKEVEEHPLYEAFFKDIKGCGTLMSAMCIAYLDPYKARYVSSFYRYCGLDTVRDTDSEGNVLFLTTDRRKVREKYLYVGTSGEAYYGKVKAIDDFDAEGNQYYMAEETGELLTKQAVYRIIDGVDTAVYEDIETGEEYVGDVRFSEHGRRMGDTEMFDYVDKDGNVKQKRGLTYNPVLKTKLMGVLSGCLIKAKDPIYTEIYYDYKSRLDKEQWSKDFTPAHKNMMAQRYMIKQYLRNLWVKWRELEGLEINYPYEVAKLGNQPHKFNKYQCESADRYSAQKDA